MAKVADSIENNPSNLFEALADFGVSFDELRFKAEEVSKRLSKPPSIEQMLKGT